MSILDRYIGGVVLRSTALVLFVILALDAVSDLLEQMGELQSDYNLGAALLYVALKIPGSAVDYLGFSALIGCLVGIGGLSNNSELTVIRAAGVSTLQVVGMVLKPTLLLILCGSLISEFVAPNLEQVAQSRKDLLRGTADAQQASGTWLRDGSEYMHVNAVYPGGELYGVSRFRLDGRELQAMSFAERVLYEDGIWIETRVRETEFLQDQTEVMAYSTRTWETELTPDILDMASMLPAQLSIRDLNAYSRYLGLDTRFAGSYRLAFWSKIMSPLAVMALVLVGLSFVYGASRSVSIGQRIFLGVLVAVVFKLAQDILGPASSIWGFSPLIAVATPILISTLAGAWLLKRQG
jgi:lipopolysaccharide export system permease protein